MKRSPVIRDNSFHDRYFIVDRSRIYLIGASLNLAGTKSFMIIKTPIAAEMSIKIMRVFVAMRYLIRDNREIFMSLDNINDRLTNYDNRLTNQETKITNHDKKN